MAKLEIEIDFKALGEVLAEHDFVEVIRCKDCKWFNDIGCAIRIVDDSDKPKDDDYCSFGERKDESTMSQVKVDVSIKKPTKRWDTCGLTEDSVLVDTGSRGEKVEKVRE